VKRGSLGKVVISPLDMVLTPHRMVQPDVAFIATENLGILRDVIRGPADLVAEIVSPGSRRRDRVDKKDLYEQHGVKEYWVVDPEARSVDVWHLTPGRQYDLAGRFLENEEAQSRLLAGFKLSIRLLLDGE
jgi:Uma2 family endonuclease